MVCEEGVAFGTGEGKRKERWGREWKVRLRLVSWRRVNQGARGIPAKGPAGLCIRECFGWTNSVHCTEYSQLVRGVDTRIVTSNLKRIRR